VTNTGERDGADVPQLYLVTAAGHPRTRLLGFERVHLTAGESRHITNAADPRVIARFDQGYAQWRIDEGEHHIAVGRSAAAPVLSGAVHLVGRRFGR